jgi:TetR/AcrR family transcriptional repressor of mexCD-oprJ operon
LLPGCHPPWCLQSGVDSSTDRLISDALRLPPNWTRCLTQAASVLQAAQATLSPGRVQELHAKPEQRVHNLIRRGQTESVFRADIPADLLAGVLHHVLHGAAMDVAAGRLDPIEAPRFIAEMALAVCAVPPATPQR